MSKNSSMTSEHIDYIAEAIRGSFGDRCPEHADDCPTCEAWKQYDNLKVVPDMPELVRYDISMFGNGAVEMWDGEYVRYDQAAEIIAAKDKEIERLRSATTHRMD